MPCRWMRTCSDMESQRLVTRGSDTGHASGDDKTAAYSPSTSHSTLGDTLSKKGAGLGVPRCEQSSLTSSWLGYGVGIAEVVAAYTVA